MRIRRVCASSLVALSLACAADAYGQGWPAQINPGYPPPGYGMPGYGMPGYGMPPVFYGQPGVPPYAAPPPGYVPGYPVYPNPSYYVTGQPAPVLPSVPQTGTTTTVVPAQPTTRPVAPSPAPSSAPGAQPAPESIPAPGTGFYDDVAAGEPMVQFVGQTNPGILPPLRHAVPERPGQERWWVSIGYLASFFRNEHFSTPLVTTGSTLDTHPAGLGQPGTGILFGGDNERFGMFSGIKLEAGIFLGCDQCWSLDWAGFYYFPNHIRFSANSDSTGNPIVARPVFDVVNGFERAFIDGFPAVAAGGTAIDIRSLFFGTEANITYHTRPCEHTCVDWLFGFRYLRLEETLQIDDQLRALKGENLQFLNTFINTTDVLTDFDSFRAVNKFYGLQFGGRLKYEWDHVFVDGFTKLGFGVNDEHVDINGGSALATPAGIRTAVGGILALPSNIGTHTRTTFGFVPEFGFDVGVRLTPHTTLSAGYSFLLWTQVARPGNQINRAVNPATVPSDNSFGAGGPAAPIFQFSGENFWVHTFSLMLNFKY
jgi:hypothetical protein